MGFKKIDQDNVIIHEDHLGDKVAESIGYMSARIAKVLAAAGKKQADSLDKLVSDLEAIRKKEDAEPVPYRLVIVDRDNDGNIKEATLTPIMGDK
jgi:Ca2+-binding EF-hand superfamily protein